MKNLVYFDFLKNANKNNKQKHFFSVSRQLINQIRTTLLIEVDITLPKNIIKNENMKIEFHQIITSPTKVSYFSYSSNAIIKLPHALSYVNASSNQQNITDNQICMPIKKKLGAKKIIKDESFLHLLPSPVSNNKSQKVLMALKFLKNLSYAYRDNKKLENIPKIIQNNQKPPPKLINSQKDFAIKFPKENAIFGNHDIKGFEYWKKQEKQKEEIKNFDIKENEKQLSVMKNSSLIYNIDIRKYSTEEDKERSQLKFLNNFPQKLNESTKVNNNNTQMIVQDKNTRKRRNTVVPPQNLFTIEEYYHSDTNKSITIKIKSN